LEDANFTVETADSAILRLYTQIKWTEEVLSEKLRDGEPNTFDDKVFDSLINLAIVETDKHYEKTNFREALRTGFFSMQTARDNYKVAVGGTHANMNKQLTLKFIEVQALLIAPICPHFSQYIWKLLGKTGFIQRARWPEAGVIDLQIIQKSKYLQEVVHQFRLRKDAHMKPRKIKGQQSVPVTPPTSAIIQVAKSYPKWMQTTLITLHPYFTKAAPALPDKKELQSMVSANQELKTIMKQVMPFIDFVLNEVERSGMSALELKLSFDEKVFLEESLDVIKKALGVDIKVEYTEEDESGNIRPGQPHISFK